MREVYPFNCAAIFAGAMPDRFQRTMHMVRHNLHSMQRERQLFRLRNQQLFQPCLDRSTQDLLRYFGRKRGDISVKYRVSIASIALMFHATIVPSMLDIVNISNMGCLPLGRGTRNWLAANLPSPVS